MKIGLLCGGPSLERGISLNSARSVLDHLADETIEIVPVYFDHNKKAYKISTAQLYSNTPSDFDFKLSQTAMSLSHDSLIRLLQSVDIVFPAMHGPFGEDGEIQSFLEKNQIPFVGSDSQACKKAFDKYSANRFLAQNGFHTLPPAVLKIYGKDHARVIREFFLEHKIKRAIVKPATGGSSIGVFSVSTPEEALEKSRFLFSRRMDTRVVIEPFAEGIEFTTIVLQNRFGLPVAILPTEIETDYTENQIFDFRKKYLPTRQVTYHCPPRFNNEIIEKIQVQAEQIFKLFDMKDFARFDGWILKDGTTWFSDLNPISGMEQNSFLFQQASRVGLSHRDALRFIVRRACERQGISFRETTRKNTKDRKSVSVLFGGSTSERQVSLMSGTNVWLKLRKSDAYNPKPYLLEGENTVWELPYAYTLNHTVEEIAANCKAAEKAEERLGYLEQKVRIRLGLLEGESTEPMTLPRKMTLPSFLKESKFVFIALHGGMGEDGRLQKILSEKDIPFNGPGENVSRLCMDKYLSAKFISKSGVEGVSSIPSLSLSLSEIKSVDPSTLWKRLRTTLNAKTIIAKPRSDGCSSGVVHLYTHADLRKYLDLVKQKAPHIPTGTFVNQSEIIEMPLDALYDILFEKFVETDVLRVKGNAFKYKRKSGWIEVTVAVVTEGDGLKVFNPSVTIAEGEVLSVEEKFQGGTGINITPPPVEIIKEKTLEKVKERIRDAAKKIGITGYSRIDAFIHVATGNVMIIEVNTLPGLTPSTVLYHQALAESSPIYPTKLLEMFVKNKGY
ncbi:hypothetical protein HY090_00510 [Candidatus Kaiserbacteria bacterium]|nr:hypothetical protein [Candidatus Kaiserbacteria bacterium]